MKKLKQWLRVRMAYSMAMISLWPKPKIKFVVFGQGRTGSTLLVDLLNGSGDIHCDREIFNIFHFTGQKIKDPLRYITGRSKRFFSKAYGFKVKVYQWRYDHGVESPEDVLNQMVENGYKIIYLSRLNVIEHAFSNVRRSLTGITHIRDNSKSTGKIEIPVRLLLEEISDRLKFKAEEVEVLKGLQYFPVVYEHDLENPARHLQTVNSIRKYLGLTEVQSVGSQYRKIGEKALVDQISNYDDVVTALRNADLEHLINKTQW